MTGESRGFLQDSFFSELLICKVQPQDSTAAFVSKGFVPAPIRITRDLCVVLHSNVHMLAVFSYPVFYQHEGSLFLLLQCVVNTKAV